MLLAVNFAETFHASDDVFGQLFLNVQDGPEFAPGTQKKVTGEVIRWNNVSGPEKLDAVKYIELLEAEIEELNRQIERKSSDGQNDLLDYLKTLEPQNLKVRIIPTDSLNILGKFCPYLFCSLG